MNLLDMSKLILKKALCFVMMSWQLDFRTGILLDQKKMLKIICMTHANKICFVDKGRIFWREERKNIQRIRYALQRKRKKLTQQSFPISLEICMGYSSKETHKEDKNITHRVKEFYSQKFLHSSPTSDYISQSVATHQGKNYLDDVFFCN